MNLKYLLLTMLVMILGIIGWVAIFGLTVTVFLDLPGANAIAPYRFTWQQGIMYLIFGLISGYFVTIKAPNNGLLHNAVSMVLFGLIWFRLGMMEYYPYFLLMLSAALLAGGLATWQRQST